MKTRSLDIYLFGLLVCIYGCGISGVITVRETPSGTTYNDGVPIYPISSIHLRNGDVQGVNDIRFNRDSVQWINAGIETGVPIDSVEYLEGGDFGGDQGLGIGMFIGGVIGSVISIIDEDQEWYVGAIELGVIGGAVGFVSGAIVGFHYTYTFVRE